MSEHRQHDLILVSHCVLNQNAVVQPLARSAGPLAEALDWILCKGYGIYQLPCPEFRFLGPARRPMSVEEYNTPGFHRNNEAILHDVVADLQRIVHDGRQIVGAVLIEQSPSCDPQQGNWASDLFDALEKEDIHVGDIRQVPVENDGKFDPEHASSYFGPPCLRIGPPGGARTSQSAQVPYTVGIGSTPQHALEWRKTQRG